MAISGIGAAANILPPNPQVSQSSGHHHRRGSHHMPSLTDLDAQSSSVTSAGSLAGKVGATVNMTA
jgi:hypothetical protein